MSAASDRHEKNVAQLMGDLLPEGWKAVRPTASVKYSDIRIDQNGRPKAWVEVKMSHSDNLFNARPSYIDGKFVYDKLDSKIKRYVIDQMSGNIHVKHFIRQLKKFLGRDRVDILSAKPGSAPVPTSNAGRLKLANDETIQAYDQRNMMGFTWSQVERSDNVVSWYEFTDFFSDKASRYFGKLILGDDITNLGTTHYNEGKATRVDYIQTGADFYRLGDRDPLGLGKEIPLWQAGGDFRVRIALGSTRGGRTEIMPELKAKKVKRASNFGCDPRKPKENPFLALT